jgi:uncharacterized Zn finger protein
MCKHVAAVLYGVGVRLDREPALFFTLRQVDQQALVADAGADLSARRPPTRPDKVLVTDDLSALFGIDITDEAPAAPRAAPATARRRASRPRKSPPASGKKR